ncbi:MAG: SagB/ThcOx family dehydrogenase [Deferribacteres bacterium]|nr:SagB/ThcOx family dehydrogenase [Deferribacteres bacterium]
MLTVGEQFFQETKYKKGKPLPKTVVRENPAPYKVYKDVPVFPLPEPRVDGGPPLWDVLRRRRSIRNYNSYAYVEKEVLSQLLWAIQGITGRVGPYLLRTAPSAGALYPYETYLFIKRVRGFSPGIYHFNVPDFSLEFLVGGDYSFHLQRACLDQPMLSRAAVVFIWSAVIERCRVKYGERAFRYIFMDVAHVCQNLYLAATGLGLGCCAVGAFLDDDLNDILGINGITESVVYLATVGAIN